jgi:hypothetical protein
MKKVTVFLLVIFSGCLSFKPDSEYITGEWTDFIPKQGVHYYSGEEHKFTFKNDSFYYHAERWTDIERENDTCIYYKNNFFAAGKYLAKEDKLYLKGISTDYHYSAHNVHPCAISEPFELVYTLNIISENQMTLKLPDSVPYTYDWKYSKEMTLSRIK